MALNNFLLPGSSEDNTLGWKARRIADWGIHPRKPYKKLEKYFALGLVYTQILRHRDVFKPISEAVEGF